jgi:hypothetical protein
MKIRMPSIVLSVVIIFLSYTQIYSQTTPITCSSQSIGAIGCDVSKADSAGNVFLNEPFFSTSPQSGQSYKTRPSWNVAGVDRGTSVGYKMNTKFVDPSLAVNLPQGCQYYEVGILTYVGPLVFCNSGQNLTIENMDFNLHGCIKLFVTPKVTGVLTIKNNKFVNGPKCDASKSGFVNIGVGSHVNLVLTNNVFDGGFPAYQGLGVALSDMSVGTALKGCQKVIRYNVFANLPGLPMGAKGSHCDIDIAYNYFSNWVANAKLGIHGAIYAMTPDPFVSVNSLAYRYNTTLIPASTGQIHTTTFSFLGAAAKRTNITNAIVDHNTVIVNSSRLANLGVSTGAALTQALHLGSITNLTITNNYVDPTGAYACATNVGDTAYVTGTIDNGAGGFGVTLNVTQPGGYGGGIYPGAFFGASSNDPLGGEIAPYGTVSPDTGLATTGTGAGGTYVLKANPQKRSSNKLNTFNTPILETKTVNNNVNLLNGSAITIAGIQWNAGECFGRHR